MPMILSATFAQMVSKFIKVFHPITQQKKTTFGYAKISQGGIVETVFDTMIIAKYWVEVLTKSVILCHNNPSGTLFPSEADKVITKKIAEALKVFDCKVLDHIILTEESHFSFADDGLI